MKMENRKVQRIGHSTLAVSIPHRWTKTNNVKKGDELTVCPLREGKLIVMSSDQPRDTNTAVINGSSITPTVLRQAVIAQYTAGLSRIEIVSDDLSPESMSALKEIERTLLGLTRLEKSDDTVLLRCSVDPDDFSFVNLIERLEQTSRRTIDTCMKALLQSDPEYLNLVSERRIHRLRYLAKRLYTVSQNDPRVARSFRLSDNMRLDTYGLILENLEMNALTSLSIARLADQIEHTQTIDSTNIRLVYETADQVTSLTKSVVQAVLDSNIDQCIECRNRATEVMSGPSEGEKVIDEPQFVREIASELRHVAAVAARCIDVGINTLITENSDFINIKYATK